MNRAILVNDISQWVADERLRQGLSVNDLAAKSNMSKSAIVKVENGKTTIPTSISAFIGLGYDFSLVDGKIYAIRKE